MAFFKKNKVSEPEEHKLIVIEHNFLTDEIAYKYPVENFYPGSVLIVKPGQEAIFVKEGHAEPWPNGRHTLITENFPNMKKFSRMYNNQEIYNCYIYFINKEKPVKCFWGTPDPILIESDKYYGSTFRITGNGDYTLSIDNSLRLLGKTIGQLESYNAEDIDDFIFSEVIQRIVSKIGKAVQKDNILFSQLSSHTYEISKDIRQMLINDEVFEEFGFKLNTFTISSLKLHDEDYEKVQEMDKTWRENRMKSEMEKRRLADEGMGKAEAFRNQGFAEADVMRAKGMAEADIMKQKGAYYAQERAYDVLEKAAANEGGGNVGGMNMMTGSIGIGMGVGLGQGFGQAMGQVATNAFGQGSLGPINNQQGTPNMGQDKIICTNCNTQNPPSSKFCCSCGQKLEVKVFCTNCGTLLVPGSKFCNNCGNKCEN